MRQHLELAGTLGAAQAGHHLGEHLVGVVLQPAGPQRLDLDGRRRPEAGRGMQRLPRQLGGLQAPIPRELGARQRQEHARQPGIERHRGAVQGLGLVPRQRGRAAGITGQGGGGRGQAQTRTGAARAGCRPRSRSVRSRRSPPRSAPRPGRAPPPAPIADRPRAGQLRWRRVHHERPQLRRTAVAPQPQLQVVAARRCLHRHRALRAARSSGPTRGWQVAGRPSRSAPSRRSPAPPAAGSRWWTAAPAASARPAGRPAPGRSAGSPTPPAAAATAGAPPTRATRSRLGRRPAVPVQTICCRHPCRRSACRSSASVASPSRHHVRRLLDEQPRPPGQGARAQPQQALLEQARLGRLGQQLGKPGRRRRGQQRRPGVAGPALGELQQGQRRFQRASRSRRARRPAPPRPNRATGSSGARRRASMN